MADQMELDEFRDRMAEAFQIVGERFSKDIDDLRARVDEEVDALETRIEELEEQIEAATDYLMDHAHADGRVMVPYNGQS